MPARPDLAEAARFELYTREVTYPQQVAQNKRSADDAGRSIAAWRAIAELMRSGTAAFEQCLGDTPALAWTEIVAAAHAAAEHRIRKALADDSDEALARCRAARQIRDLLMRSAIRAGAEIPSFDEPTQAERKAA